MSQTGARTCVYFSVDTVCLSSLFLLDMPPASVPGPALIGEVPTLTSPLMSTTDLYRRQPDHLCGPAIASGGIEERGGLASSLVAAGAVADLSAGLGGVPLLLRRTDTAGRDEPMLLYAFPPESGRGSTSTSVSPVSSPSSSADVLLVSSSSPTAPHGIPAVRVGLLNVSPLERLPRLRVGERDVQPASFALSATAPSPSGTSSRVFPSPMVSSRVHPFSLVPILAEGVESPGASNTSQMGGGSARLPIKRRPSVISRTRVGSREAVQLGGSWRSPLSSTLSQSGSLGMAPPGRMSDSLSDSAGSSNPGQRSDRRPSILKNSLRRSSNGEAANGSRRWVARGLACIINSRQALWR